MSVQRVNSLSGIGGRQCATARDRGDDAVNVDAAHARVAEIGNVDVSSRVQCDTVRLIQLGQCGRAAIAGESRQAGTGNGFNGARGRNPANSIIRGVGDVDATQPVDSTPSGCSNGTYVARLLSPDASLPATVVIVYWGDDESAATASANRRGTVSSTE